MATGNNDKNDRKVQNREAPRQSEGLAQCRLAPFNRDDLILTKRVEDGKEVGYIQYMDLEAHEVLVEKAIPLLYDEVCTCGLDAVFDAISDANAPELNGEIKAIFMGALLADRSNIDILLEYSKRLPKKYIPEFIWRVLRAPDVFSIDTLFNSYYDPVFEKLFELDADAIFNSKNLNKWTMRTVARLPCAAKYPQFREFFMINDREVKQSLAMNPEAPKLDEYKRFFEEYNEAMIYATLNPNAALLPAYAEFLKKNELSNIRIAANPNAAHLSEFKRLFALNNFTINRIIACNPAARSLPEYADLIPPEYGFNLEIILSNSDVDKYKEIQKILEEGPSGVGTTKADEIKFKEYRDKHLEKKTGPLLSLAELKQADIKARQQNNERLRDPNIITDPNFMSYLKDPNEIWSIISNPISGQFKEIRALFDSKDLNNLSYLASKEHLTKLPEYKKLFKIKDPEVLREIAGNPNATQLEEFKQLFLSKDESIQERLLNNPNARKLHEFVQLFSTDYGQAAISLPESAQFPEFRQLLTHKDALMRYSAAHNPNAVQFPEFGKLFYDYALFEDTTDSVMAAAVGNPNAINHPEFRKLFTRTPPTKPEELFVFINVLSNVAAREETVQFPEYKELFKLLRFYTKEVRECESMEDQMMVCLQLCDEEPKLDKKWIQAIFTAMEHLRTYPTEIMDADIIDMFPEQHYDDLFSHLNMIISSIACNLEAPKIKEYTQLFNLIDEEYFPIVEAVIHNEAARSLPEYRKYHDALLHTKYPYDNNKKDHQVKAMDVYPLRRATFYSIYFHANNNAIDSGIDSVPVRFSIDMKSNPKIYDSPEYRRLFYDWKGIEWIAKDPNALRCPEFKNLFNAYDIEVRYEAYRTYYNHLNEQFRRFGIPPSAKNTPKVQACEKITEQVDTIIKNYQKEWALLPKYTEALMNVLHAIEHADLDPIPKAITDLLEQILIPKDLVARIGMEMPRLVTRIEFRIET